MKLAAHAFLLLFLGSCCCACALFESPAPPLDLQFEETPPTTPMVQTPLPAGSPMMIEPLTQTKELTDVEIVFTTENSEAEGFLVRYGPAASSLIHEKKVQLSELKKVKEGSQDAYIIVVEDTDPSEDLYLTVSEYRGTNISPPSEVMSIPAAGN